MPIEVIVLAMASASPEAIAARSSCAIVYADNIIDRIACEVYSNPDAYGPDTIAIVKSMPIEAKKRGKKAYTWCGSAQQLELADELGFDYAALANDPFYLKNGVNATLDQLSFRK